MYTRIAVLKILPLIFFLALALQSRSQTRIETSPPRNRFAANPAADPHAARKGIRAIDRYRQELTAQAPGAGLPLPSDGCDPHPGTVDACPMMLSEAIGDGIVDLTSKGHIFGDEVAINVDNTNPQNCTAVNVTLFIEFYGEGATETEATLFKEAVEQAWNGFTSTDGRPVTVEVVCRVAPGATTPPGTQGFHQIELLNTSFRDVVYGMGSDFDINRGAGSGQWAAGSENDVYAHEAGHLMMFPDLYDDYEKQADGTWKNLNTNAVVTEAKLTDLLLRMFPTWSQSERANYLAAKGAGSQVSITQDGHVGDIMGNYENGKVQQYEIDALAAKAQGLNVKIRRGDVLPSKTNYAQNVMIIHNEDIYVPKGQKKQCGGLYAACIDGTRIWSNAGVGFDVAPSLSTWPRTRAVALLMQLLDYIDLHDDYKTLGFPQNAIWRLTDNEGIGEKNSVNYLSKAGISVGDTLFAFPHIADPESTNTPTQFILPRELIIPVVSPGPIVVRVGDRIQQTAGVSMPALSDSTVRMDWLLGKPDSSAAQFAGPSNDTLRYTTDVRGVYIPTLRLRMQSSGGSSSTLIPARGVVVAADAMTETCESGSLRGGAPFFWATTPGRPWIVCDSDAWSGRYALHSTYTGINGSSDLSAKFSIPDSGWISFAYRAGSGDFMFSRDYSSEELYGYFHTSKEWQYASYRLAPGVHTVTWSYSVGEPADSTGSMVTTGAWLDDIFFPPGAALIRTPVEGNPVPERYSLSQNYPNPFAATTQIQYSLAAPQPVSLIVYDALGREVRRLVDEAQPAGTYSVRFTGAGLAPGIYFYRIAAGGFRETRRMVVY